MLEWLNKLIQFDDFRKVTETIHFLSFKSIQVEFKSIKL